MSGSRRPAPERDPGVEEILRSRREAGPVPRKLPGPVAWFDVRSRSTGHLAFSMNRITGLGIVVYLYLHLAVLSLLLGGEDAGTPSSRSRRRRCSSGSTCCWSSACSCTA